MTTDLEETARQALRTYVDAAPMPPGDVDAVLSRSVPAATVWPVRPVRGWRISALAAAAVLLVVGGTSFAPALFGSARPDAGPSGPSGVPTLPATIHSTDFPGMLLTGRVSENPAGRAIALYRQNNGAGISTSFQSVVLSADGDRYRRVDQAEAHEGWTVMLAPDGTRAAFPGLSEGRLTVTVVDLDTGRARHHLIGPRDPTDVRQRLLAWSTDGRHVAYQIAPRGDSNGLEDSLLSEHGRLAVLDLESGRSTEFPAYTKVTRAAFAPGGEELAVQDGLTLVVVGLDGRERRTVTPPDPRYGLDGPAAWSPDGAWLATSALWYTDPETSGPIPQSAYRLTFVDATGRGRRPPAPVVTSQLTESVLGWRSPDRLLIHDAIWLPDDQIDRQVDQNGLQHKIVEVTLSTGERRTVSFFGDEGNGDDSDITDLQLATGLLADAEVRPAAAADYGPWPRWARITVMVLVGVPSALVLGTILLVLRARRSRRSAVGPTELRS